MSDPKAPLLPPVVRAVIARVTGVFKGFSRPARVLVIATLVMAVAGISWLGMRSAYEPYSVLFAQMDRDDAGAAVAKLKELKIPYRVTGEGGVIEVPEARVHETRLELASAGLPRGGGVGFETFDKMHLGATEFEQRVMFRRAMEGELARTISSVDAIQSARVHLVLPEKSVFAARREPASASVIVRLRHGRAVGPSEVAGIVHLVAAAVPGLTADGIALVTSDGVTLHKPKGTSAGDDAGDASDSERQSQARTLEASIEERARTMLERVIGPGHVDVRASAELDLSRMERVEDHYDPVKTALRSEEQTIERGSAGPDDTVAGVPGAESNLPTGKPAAKGASSATPAAGAAPPAPGIVRESHTRNFEVDHVQEKRTSSSGAVKRLTIAVLVDQAPGANGVKTPRSREELDKIATLVRSAVGSDEKRGDIVTVESVAFPVTEAPPPEPVAEPVSLLSKLPPPVAKYLPLAPYAGAGLGALVLLALIVAIARGRKSPRVEALSATIELGAGAKTPELAPAVEPKKLLGVNDKEEAIRRAKSDPATAALVLKRWLGTPVESQATAPHA